MFGNLIFGGWGGGFTPSVSTSPLLGVPSIQSLVPNLLGVTTAPRQAFPYGFPYGGI
jgi:hypothetical protein